MANKMERESERERVISETKISEINIVTSLFKGLDMPTKIGTTFTSALEQFWPDLLPAATNTSYRNQQELIEGLLCSIPSH